MVAIRVPTTSHADGKTRFAVQGRSRGSAALLASRRLYAIHVTVKVLEIPLAARPTGSTAADLAAERGSGSLARSWRCHLRLYAKDRHRASRSNRSEWRAPPRHFVRPFQLANLALKLLELITLAGRKARFVSSASRSVRRTHRLEHFWFGWHRVTSSIDSGTKSGRALGHHHGTGELGSDPTKDQEQHQRGSGQAERGHALGARSPRTCGTTSFSALRTPSSPWSCAAINTRSPPGPPVLPLRRSVRSLADAAGSAPREIAS